MLVVFVLWCRADLEHRVSPRQSGTAVRRPRFGSLTCDGPCRALLPQDGGCQRWLSCSDGVAVQPPVPQCGGLPLPCRAARAVTRAAATRYRETACYARGTMVGQPHDGPFAGRWHQQNDSSNSGAWQTSDASSAELWAGKLVTPRVDFHRPPKN